MPLGDIDERVRTRLRDDGFNFRFAQLDGRPTVTPRARCCHPGLRTLADRRAYEFCRAPRRWNWNLPPAVDVLIASDRE